MRKNMQLILRLVVGAIAMIALTFMANNSAFAGGPDATPTPTPLPVAGSTSYETSQTVTVDLLPKAEFFATRDCVVYDNVVVGYQTEVAKIAKGNGISVMGWSADGVWANVSDGSIDGWTLASNLSDHPPVTGQAPANACTACGIAAAPASVTTTAGGSTTNICVVSAGLNVRSGPGMKYDPPITGVSRGTRLQLTGTTASNGWVQVTTPRGVTGWVNGAPAYLGACGGAAVHAPAPAPARDTCIESEILSFSPRLRELNGEQIFDAEDITSGSFQALLFDGQHVDWPDRNDDGAGGTDGELDTRIQLFGSYVAEYFYRQGTWYRVTACSGTLQDLALRIASEKASRNPHLTVRVFGPGGEQLR